MTVNGQRHKHRVPTHLRLLDFLRDTLDLTGAKETCGEGECGACTVFLDGQTVNSCLVLAVETHGSEIITIEGLSQGGTLSDLQQAFIDEHGVQCGYCTPGIVLSATQLLREEKHPTRERIRFELAGNICRCTGYQKIFSAVANAACKHREV
ncbi:MAG: (2Fe-2S)-binding protein [Candidatus Marinimicrobia bacterium]|nr:(2Fe-2S)-binding protein [Candidatus Neomarinimicrobiota bacterium]